MTVDQVLQFLDGDAPPERVAVDLRTLASLPEAVLAALRDALEPALASHMDDRAEAALAKFCRTHGVTEAELAPGLLALRLVLLRALERDLPAAGLVNPLGRVFDDVAIVERLVALYADLRVARARTALVRALGEHGKTVMGIDWRLDTVRACQHGGNIDENLVLLTFRYQRGQAPGRVTLQLMPDMVAELRDICDKLVGRG